MNLNLNPAYYIGLAQIIAHEAHDSIGQLRKYTLEPYWVHTDEVARYVSGVTSDPVAAIGAHLHDVIEDVLPVNPKYDIYFIANQFGDESAQVVVECTDVYTKEAWPDLNRAQRKSLERQRISTISVRGKIVKLGDLISNTNSIVEHDPNFAKIYIPEKIALLEVLKGVNDTLWNHAWDLAQEAVKKLGLDQDEKFNAQFTEWRGDSDGTVGLD